jgi:hypothetical protein
MAFQAPLTVVASAARTTTGNSGALQVPDLGEILNILLDVTAVTGTTPSMTVSMEWSHNGTTFAAVDTAEAFVAITAAKVTVKGFPIRAPFYRLVWTITGTTPSFTFSASAYTVG